MTNIIKTLMVASVATMLNVGLASAEEPLLDPKHKPEEYCLALNIYYESRGEPIEGQYAVADVVLNRVEDENFPDSICDVVKQCAGNSCQFSWIAREDNPKPREIEAWYIAQMISLEIMHEDTNRGITNGATYFHAMKRYPNDWPRSFKLTTEIGSHKFYMDPRS